MGADLSESVLKEIVATSCNFSYANLNAEKMQNACWKECDFSFADVAMGKLKGVAFSKCDFTRVNFYTTSLKGINLSDSKLGGIEISADLSELKGATINAVQAADLIKNMGVLVQ